ncbi:hypothetical protein L1281_001218 [Neisseria sp. HSC-16F19]|nr:BPSS1780 family membrane protein [Neisseria sp. HSC-16F19]MCP2040635.1 hypothetical protein [Neisseria sp. HSC-16F19]
MNEPDYRHTYAAPQPLERADFDDSGIDGYLGQALSRPASHVTLWLGNAWAIFKQQPLLWIGAGLFHIIISLVLPYIPLIGSLLQIFAALFLGAGFAYAAAQVEYHDRFDFGDIFAGFQHNMGNLAILALLSLLFIVVEIIVLGLVLLIVVGGLGIAMGGSSALTEGFGIGVGLGVILLFTLALIPYIALFYLAPALVLLQNETPLRAIALSWQAFIRNFGGAVLCALLMAVLMLVALIPLGLGLLVAIPLTLILPYVIYRDLFFE